MKNYSEYLQALDVAKANIFIERAVQKLRVLDFDAIAFTGSSGALIAPMLALRLGKGLILIRKGGPRSNKSHSVSVVEGMLGAKRYIIVDDFICSGRTIITIAQKIRKYLPARIAKPMLVGVYEYARKVNSKYGKLHTQQRIFNASIKKCFDIANAQPQRPRPEINLRSCGAGASANA